MKNTHLIVAFLVASFFGLFLGTACGQESDRLSLSNIYPLLLQDDGFSLEVIDLSATEGDGQVVLTWTDPADSDFNHVTISWSPADGISQPVTVNKGVQTETITGLENGTLYTFTVKTVDGDSNTSTGVTDTATPDGPVYSFTFDTSPLGGLWTAVGDWEWGTPDVNNFVEEDTSNTLGPPGAYDGGCLCTDVDGDYSSDMAHSGNYVQVGPLDLSGLGGSVELHFMMWFEIDNEWDFGQVQVSTDGTNFSALPMTTPEYNDDSSQAGTTYDEWESDFLNWTGASADLSTYAGESTVYLRWSIRSDGIITQAGFYIDNVEIATIAP
jgi:hypothetical protein